MRTKLALLTFVMSTVLAFSAEQSPDLTGAAASLELTVDTEYPRRLQLKVPVQEDSNFDVRTSFGMGEFFTATGHVGRVTGLTTNRSISLTYGYDYYLGNSHGSATGSQDQPLMGPSVRVVSSILAANPGFTVREVARPVSPGTWLTTATRLTNVTGDADIRRKIVGTWTHNIPWIDGKERKLILKGSQDTHGKVYFEFIQQPFSYKPIFTGFNVEQGQVEISFKMVLYSDESDVSLHTLKYVLRETSGIWSGRLFQSWEKSPVDVTLKKQS